MPACPPARLPADSRTKQWVDRILPATGAAGDRVLHDDRGPCRHLGVPPDPTRIVGPLDDVVAVVLLLRYAARSIPRETLLSSA
jgi:hypothetical protein